jgi:hypothetical protein
LFLNWGFLSEACAWPTVWPKPSCAFCALQLLADEGVRPEGLPSDLPSWRQMDRTRPAESLGASALAELEPPGVRVAQ